MSEEKDYSREAVLERLSGKRVAKERNAFLPALVLDGIVLLIALGCLWSAFTAATRDEAMLGIAGAVIGAPALFAISRFVRSRPTPLGWVWLALSALSLAWLLVTELLF
jgi:hypothetical protein